MKNNKCCTHCEYLHGQDDPHSDLTEICRLDLGRIYRCNNCGSSWMKSPARGWLILRMGSKNIQMAAGF
ncbi:MAG: hypothetical protein ACPGF7_15145, partial [Pontibacterium sp.]